MSWQPPPRPGSTPNPNNQPNQPNSQGQPNQPNSQGQPKPNYGQNPFGQPQQPQQAQPQQPQQAQPQQPQQAQQAQQAQPQQPQQAQPNFGQNPFGQGQPNPQGQPKPQQIQGANPDSQNYYQLLQVTPDSSTTVIRYAYRYLAAMYHPDNAESGNADMFRLITEAWKTLSDETKRQMYDISIGFDSQAKAQAQTQATQAGQPQDAHSPAQEKLQKIKPKSGLAWDEIELRLAVLQVLLQARRKRPQTGGATAKMLMECLGMNDITEMEFVLWYLREKGLIEIGERVFMISVAGFDYLTDQLSKTMSLDATKTEQKVSTAMSSNLPAVIDK